MLCSLLHLGRNAAPAPLLHDAADRLGLRRRDPALHVDQAALLRSVKGARGVESLLAESMLNHFEACRNLWAFRVIGLIRRVEETTPLDDDGLEYVLPADGA